MISETPRKGLVLDAAFSRYLRLELLCDGVTLKYLMHYPVLTEKECGIVDSTWSLECIYVVLSHLALGSLAILASGFLLTYSILRSYVLETVLGFKYPHLT